MKNERDYGAELKEYEAKVVGEKELFDLFKPIEGKRQKKILAVNGIGKGNNADIGEINCVLEKLIAEEFSVDLFNAQDIANLLTISGKNIESGKTLDFQKVLKNNYSYA
ncbi:MAG: hypothetical protein Q8O89_05650, partial [Nanoarchaeota archaeon]|nr:hypothetical protein [Nanoarchaeota archaeon]